MNITFKTPELYNWLIYIQKIFPAQKSLIASYIPKFADINLSISHYMQPQETYLQKIHLSSGDTLHIVWEIDPIINEIKTKKNIPVHSVSIEKILNDDNVVHSDFNSILINNFKIGYPHKLDSIIIGELPIFPQKTVIDGNHRLLEAYKAGVKNINYYNIIPQDAVKFLQKDAQQFIFLSFQLFQFLQ